MVERYSKRKLLLKNMGTFKEDLQNQLVAIYETIDENIQTAYQYFLEIWLPVTAIVVILAVLLLTADPAPPRHVLMGSGPPGSSHELLAKKYAEFFLRYGITLELVPSNGAVENLERLKDRKDPLMAAFTVSGALNSNNSKGVYSLGSVDYHPLWFFYRESAYRGETNRFTDMASLRVNIGAKGSSTNLIATKLLELNQLSAASSNFSDLATHDAINKLEHGELDGVFIVDDFASPNIQKLIKMKGLKIANFSRAEAYARLDPSFEMVDVPRGGISLHNDIPPEKLNLIAVTTEILVDDRLHPAIQTLFLIAAKSINGPQSFFSKEGEFPSYKNTKFERSKEADIFYQKGPPWLINHLPFWLAEFINRMAFFLLPFLALAYPLVRSTPNYYNNRIRSKINGMYGEIKFFEKDLVSSYDASQKSDFLAQIEVLEKRALDMNVPKSLSGEYYTLRTSIAFVRDCLERDLYMSPPK